MEIVLPVLVLVGLLLVYATLRARLAAFTRDLAEMRRSIEAAAASQAERATPERDAVAPLDLRRLESRVDDLRRTIERVAEDTQALRAARPNGDPLRGEIERHFRAAGWQSVTVLGASGEGNARDPRRIGVSGVKGGITYKGFVVVEEGRVVEEKMTSSHEVFP